MADGGLRKIFRANLWGFDLLSVETGGTTSGVPDLNFAKDGVEGWIENKACWHWRVNIRPMQIGWCERRLRHNSRVFCAVRRAGDELFLYHASMLRRLARERLDEVEPLGHWEGGAARWDWDIIMSLLVSSYK
jgi:hypothetical protein